MQNKRSGSHDEANYVHKNSHKDSTSVGAAQGSTGRSRRKHNAQVLQAHLDKHCGPRTKVRRHSSQSHREMSCKLNEIQATPIRLENKHEVIERTVKKAPKTYADIIKTSNWNQLPIQRKKPLQKCALDKNALRQERAKYEVTLTTKETNDVVKELINTMPAKEITERC